MAAFFKQRALMVSQLVVYACSLFRFVTSIFDAMIHSFGSSSLLLATRWTAIGGFFAAMLLIVWVRQFAIERLELREIAIFVCNLALAAVMVLLWPLTPFWQSTIALSVLLFALLLDIAYRAAIIKERGQQEVMQAQQSQRMQIAYMTRIEDNYRRTRELWHDLNHHINVISLLFEQQRSDELARYLTQMRGELESVILSVRTGNTIVDAILADKLLAARERQITLRLSLCSLESLSHIQPADLCAIFANALDNAMEACMRITGEGDSQRWIEVSAAAQQGGMSICFLNPAVVPPEFGSIDYFTSKKDKDAHGWGIRSIQRSAGRYGGNVVTGYNERRFHLVVYFPNVVHTP